MNSAQRRAPLHPLRGYTVRALEASIARLEYRLRLAAEMIAFGDLDLADDLYQAAIAHLWELDPSRYEEDDEAYLWRSMLNEMKNARRNNA